ncbi:DUF1700 domain-containing protein [Aquitalea magnusonii]|uniref:Putative membrane protein n=1 Tax=Aquitalea magnusonii TaxID=332411 RepID=A0A318JUD2_9NEIS|nr:DUF1700 domain-containing protein [Aquitalea magnusonii]PXX48117.1 putative membrane protein [Aquitalea magnusonii]
MKQQEFIKQLQDALSRLPEGERQDIIADYQEYFRDGLAAGRSEADIAAALGEPQQLARELMARHHMARWESRKSFGNLFAVVGAIAGLGFLNFMLAIPFLFYLWLLTMAALASTGILIGGLLLFGTLACNELFGWPAIHESRDVRAIWSEFAQGGPAGNIHIRGSRGETVDVVREASSGRASIHIQSRDGTVSLERNASEVLGRLQIKDETGQVDIAGLDWGLSRHGMLLTGLLLMALGGGGVFLCYLLARWTWRGLLSYGRYQLAVLDRARGAPV